MREIVTAKMSLDPNSLLASCVSHLLELSRSQRALKMIVVSPVGLKVRSYLAPVKTDPPSSTVKPLNLVGGYCTLKFETPAQQTLE